MILTYLVGPVIFLSSLGLMFILVPFKRIKEMFSLGLVAGLGIAMILLYTMQNLYGIWIFHRADIVNIMQIPFFVAAAWLPTIILFAYLLSKSNNILSSIAVIIAFPLAATAAHYVLLGIGSLTYNNWNLFYTFVMSLLLHLAIASYLYLTGQLQERILT